MQIRMSYSSIELIQTIERVGLRIGRDVADAGLSGEFEHGPVGIVIGRKTINPMSSQGDLGTAKCGEHLFDLCVAMNLRQNVR